MNGLGLFGSFYSESIDHQLDDFGKRLESKISDIRSHYVRSTEVDQDGRINGSRGDDRASDEIRAMEKIIFDRLGIRVTTITNMALAACMPLYSHANHVFTNKFWRGIDISPADQKKWIKEATESKGYVDRANAKVSGIFSTYDHQLYLNFSLMFGLLKMTAAQVTAVCLHELGHAFTFMEASHLTTTTNQVLANISQALMSPDKDDKTPYVLRELRRLDKNATEEEAAAMVTGDRVIAGQRLFEKAYGSVTSQLPNSRYDDTSSEQVADSFATRFQYGRDLADALMLMSKASLDPSVSKVGYVFSRLAELFNIGFIMLGVLAVLLGFPAALYFIFLSPFLFVVVWGQASHMEDMTYDRLRDRFTRIRNEQISLLKSARLDKEVAKRALAQLDEIDEMIKGVSNYESLITKFSNLFFSKGRAAKRTIAEQRLIEDMANNDLFASAHRL